MRNHGKEAIAEESNSFEKGEGITNREKHSFGLSDSSLEGEMKGKKGKSEGINWEKEVNRLTAEVKDRDEKLLLDAQQIIVLQTDNLRLKTEAQEYDNTIARLEEQLKVKKEELGRLAQANRSEASLSLPMLRNSVLRLVVELPSLSRDIEEMIKTLFPLLGLNGGQVELTEQARKATKARKISLLSQVMT